MAKSKHQDALTNLTEELARQDAAWSAAVAELVALEGSELRVPEDFFQDIDAACTLRASGDLNVGGLRA